METAGTCDSGKHGIEVGKQGAAGTGSAGRSIICAQRRAGLWLPTAHTLVHTRRRTPAASRLGLCWVRPRCTPRIQGLRPPQRARSIAVNRNRVGNDQERVGGGARILAASKWTQHTGRGGAFVLARARRPPPLAHNGYAGGWCPARPQCLPDWGGVRAFGPSDHIHSALNNY